MRGYSLSHLVIDKKVRSVVDLFILSEKLLGKVYSKQNIFMIEKKLCGEFVNRGTVLGEKSVVELSVVELMCADIFR